MFINFRKENDNFLKIFYTCIPKKRAYHTGSAYHISNISSYFAGIGIDDMFILMSGMAEGPSLTTAPSINDRMKYMLKKSGVAITITSITDLLAFAVGATSVFISIRTFCIYTGNKKFNFPYQLYLFERRFIYQSWYLLYCRCCHLFLLSEPTFLFLSCNMLEWKTNTTEKTFFMLLQNIIWGWQIKDVSV